MKVLLWTHNLELDAKVSNLVSASGAIIFRAKSVDELAGLARREQPLLILLGPSDHPNSLQEAVQELANNPDTRWTPTILLAEDGQNVAEYDSLLDRGAGAIVFCDREGELLEAQFRALHRSALRLATLRNTRLTDEKTGFYHQNFLLDQLQVLCRKTRRDGASFCLLFVELKGDEDSIYKAAQSLSHTVRGADLFGRWEGEMFAVLLPAAGPRQARLLADRCQAILAEHKMESRAALVSSDSDVVEAEAFVEAALNTLDEAWRGTDFLWIWEGASQSARAEAL